MALTEKHKKNLPPKSH